MQILKNNKGITLIALIITIIIMLILTSSTIMISNNYLKNFLNLGKNTNNKVVDTQSNMDILSNEERDDGIGVINDGTVIDSISLTVDVLNIDSIKAKIMINRKLGEIDYIKYGIKKYDEEEYSFATDYSTEHIFSGLLTGEKYNIKCIIHDVNNKTITLETYTGNNTIDIPCYLGKEIKNVNIKNKKWYYFYDDEDYYYFIIDGFATHEELGEKNGKRWNDSTYVVHTSGIASYTVGDYVEQYFDGATNSFDVDTEYNEEELARIFSQDNLQTKGLDKYMQAYKNGYLGDDTDKKIAYLIDTDIWNEFIGNIGTYAIGTPPIEMYIAALNRKNKIDNKQTYDLNFGENGQTIINFRITNMNLNNIFAYIKYHNVYFGGSFLRVCFEETILAGKSASNELFYVGPTTVNSKTDITLNSQPRRNSSTNYAYFVGIRPIVAVSKNDYVLRTYSNDEYENDLLELEKK